MEQTIEQDIEDIKRAIVLIWEKTIDMGGQVNNRELEKIIRRFLEDN